MPVPEKRDRLANPMSNAKRPPPSSVEKTFVVIAINGIKHGMVVLQLATIPCEKLFQNFHVWEASSISMYGKHPVSEDATTTFHGQATIIFHERIVLRQTHCQSS
jgi:hypothetical protein